MLLELEASLASFGHLITDVKFLAKAFNSFFFFSHIHRLCHSVTHNLVKNARHVSGLSFFGNHSWWDLVFLIIF